MLIFDHRDGMCGVVTFTSHLIVLILRLILNSGAHRLCNLRSGQLHQSHNLCISLKMGCPLQIWGLTHSACSAYREGRPWYAFLWLQNGKRFINVLYRFWRYSICKIASRKCLCSGGEKGLRALSFPNKRPGIQ